MHTACCFHRRVSRGDIAVGISTDVTYNINATINRVGILLIALWRQDAVAAGDIDGRILQHDKERGYELFPSAIVRELVPSGGIQAGNNSAEITITETSDGVRFINLTGQVLRDFRVDIYILTSPVFDLPPTSPLKVS